MNPYHYWQRFGSASDLKNQELFEHDEADMVDDSEGPQSIKPISRNGMNYSGNKTVLISLNWSFHFF